MREHPIIFSGPMVRALLDGRKTQTRRLAWKRHHDPHLMRDEDRPSPWQRVQPGDQLWVREAWTLTGDCAAMTAADLRNFYEPSLTLRQNLAFTASADDYDKSVQHWRPSIHMPRWASRITLHVEAVRVERLHSITDADAAAEGVDARAATEPVGMAAYRFRELWDTLHGAECWDANPEVVVLQFRALPDADHLATAREVQRRRANALKQMEDGR